MKDAKNTRTPTTFGSAREKRRRGPPFLDLRCSKLSEYTAPTLHFAKSNWVRNRGDKDESPEFNGPKDTAQIQAHREKVQTIPLGLSIKRRLSHACHCTMPHQVRKGKKHAPCIGPLQLVAHLAFPLPRTIILREWALSLGILRWPLLPTCPPRPNWGGSGSTGFVHVALYDLRSCGRVRGRQFPHYTSSWFQPLTK